MSEQKKPNRFKSSFDDFAKDIAEMSFGDLIASVVIFIVAIVSLVVIVFALILFFTATPLIASLICFPTFLIFAVGIGIWLYGRNLN